MTDISTAPGRRFGGKWILLPAAALLVFYLASPYYSIWRFREALRAHDMSGLSARIDFPSVRGALKQQIRERFLGALAKTKKKDRLTQFLAANAGDPLDQFIDSYLTPEGLAAIISDPGPVKNATSISSLPGIESSSPPEIDWSKFRHAYFTGLRDFAVDDQGIKLDFRFTGLGWKLHTVDLQLPAEKTASE